MKALLLEAVGKISYTDLPRPPVSAPDGVLVDVKAASICGSDVHGYDGTSGRRIPPIIMGHEASGEIAEVGSAVTQWREGERVTWNGLPWHVDHHMGRNPDLNWGVTRPWFDLLLGTRESMDDRS